MASVIPKSMKTALAMILPPISLGIEPNVLRPSSVRQSYLRASSDFLIDTVAGIGEGQAPRLFSSLHSPFEPSLKENATGVIASSVKVAQPAVAASSAISIVFMVSPQFSVAGQCCSCSRSPLIRALARRTPPQDLNELTNQGPTSLRMPVNIHQSRISP